MVNKFNQARSQPISVSRLFDKNIYCIIFRQISYNINPTARWDCLSVNLTCFPRNAQLLSFIALQNSYFIAK